MEDRKEYRWFLNEAKQIDHIEPCEKMLSQKLVEECMVATNRCCARFLRDRNCSGPFVGHRGFRGDRKDEVKRFLGRFLPEHAESDLTDVAVYRDIMVKLADEKQELPLRAMANRLLTRAELVVKPGVHMGMGLECYSNCTSPLRKYTDFLAHRQIKAALRDDNCQGLTDASLRALAESLTRARAASAEAELWLQCNFLADKVGETHDAHITQINSSGFTARLLDCGIDGQVDLRKDAEKFSFDRWTATATSATRQFQLEQNLKVRIERVDVTRREIELVPLAENSAEPETPD